MKEEDLKMMEEGIRLDCECADICGRIKHRMYAFSRSKETFQDLA
ncbi:hypothetical protein QUF89_13430 [Peribacillus simplex]|uniref:Uncharacterized protein n=1 Tax=Peribacillus simplex TaxID=1478 RepID=A0AAW7IP74_9BACI|nr:hypothetical protein [Peribacillus simplex]